MARMPILFLGHGNPMNAIQSNAWTEAWAKLGQKLPQPRAILSVSAHWYVSGCRVSADEKPRTIHDFGGFPRALHQVQYTAPGSPALAARVRDLLAPASVEMDQSWGLDHGTWSLLVHMYQGAQIPVVQLGIDETLTAREHFALARRLRPLREEGVLILGSGDVVHNLHTYAWGRKIVEPYDWALAFEGRIRRLIEARDFDPVVDYESMGEEAALSAPTPDHYLPLLYVLAQVEREDAVSFPVEGFDGGSVSMLGVLAEPQRR
jgi:4,5-DOPA dioxygenase extradiol